jgi:alanine-alpha-ketoisovalerate/valine-pyruvate aminotransferase
MSKIGRNAPCPCGSGKKYKKCCLLNQDARPTSVPPIKYRAVYTDLDQLSNSVVDLINQNELDKAEAVSRRLLSEYPDQVDGALTAWLWCMKPGGTEKKLPNITAKQQILRDQTRALPKIALIGFWPRQKEWNQINKTQAIRFISDHEREE